MKNKSPINIPRQKGVVLAITLILLVLITLLAVSGMRATIMEERMAGNSRNLNISFQMAETALREAENQLRSATNVRVIADAVGNTVNGVTACMNNVDTLDFTIADWANIGQPACPYVGTADDAITKSPEFFVEFQYFNAPAMMGGEGDCFYRITARGYGADNNSQTTLQSTYKFSLCS